MDLKLQSYLEHIERSYAEPAVRKSNSLSARHPWLLVPRDETGYSSCAHDLQFRALVEYVRECREFWTNIEWYHAHTSSLRCSPPPDIRYTRSQILNRMFVQTIEHLGLSKK